MIMSKEKDIVLILSFELSKDDYESTVDFVKKIYEATHISADKTLAISLKNHTGDAKEHIEKHLKSFSDKILEKIEIKN